MPLTLAEMGRDYVVRQVTGNDKIKFHLQNLGFTDGAGVTVVSKINGDFIVNVRETRIAINCSLPNKILVC